LKGKIGHAPVLIEVDFEFWVTGKGVELVKESLRPRNRVQRPAEFVKASDPFLLLGSWAPVNLATARLVRVVIGSPTNCLGKRVFLWFRRSKNFGRLVVVAEAWFSIQDL